MHFRTLLKHDFKWRVLYLASFFATLTILGVSAFNFYQPTVSSDKDDYAPGEIATITGYGWTQDSMVHVEFKEEPDYPDYHVYDVVVDADGKWEIKYQVESRHIGVKFTVTAKGMQTGTVAQTTFTDANVEFKASGLPNGTAVTVRYRVGTTNTGPQSTLSFITPSSSASVAVTENQTIYYTFDDITLNGVVYSAPGGSQTGTKNNGKISLEAVYTPSCTSPSISTQPVNSSISYGDNATFSVVASGSGTLTYQWQEGIGSPAVWSNITNGGIYSNATTTTLTLANPGVQLSGRKYRVMVTGQCNPTAISNEVTLTVNKAASTITVTGSTSFTYNGNAQGPSSSNKTGSTGSVSYSYSGTSTGNVTYGPSATAPILAGNYSVVATLAADNNYNGATSAPFAFSIGKAATTTTVTIVGGPFTYTGGTQTPATVSVTGAGGLNLSPTASYTNNVNAGTATASYSFAGDANYEASSDSKNFSISKKAATVVAADKTKEYGAVDPVLTGTLTGFLAADNVTASYARATGETVAGGPYAITATLSPAEVLGNYEITNTSGQLSITPRQITISAGVKSKYCGQIEPSLTYQITSGNLVYADQFSGNLVRVSGESVGTYAINQGSVALSSNYNLSYNSSLLTIIGTAVDASASGTPVPYGTTALLTAKVTPSVAGINVTFKLDGVAKGVAVTDATGVAKLSVSGLAVNVYKLEVSTGVGCGSSFAYLPVYDPNGGFVTGGGWINSPSGASVNYPDAVGKANFGFVSKYKKGSSQVDGNTEFQFQAGNLNFTSTLHEAGSLVISGGKASYRGDGSVNGVSGYKFTLTAIDGNWNSGTGPDKFRIKIWGTNGVIYDNQMGKDDNSSDATDIGGGSIVIHEVKSSSKSSALVVEIPDKSETSQFYNYPNMFTDKTMITFSLEKSESYLLEVYDMRGVLIKKVDMGVAEAGKLYEFEFNGSSLSKGMYIARLLTPSGAKSVKMILNK